MPKISGLKHIKLNKIHKCLLVAVFALIGFFILRHFYINFVKTAYNKSTSSKTTQTINKAIDELESCSSGTCKKEKMD
tara:strand:+ start:451 stop:684 length:234 start_codon:yes stop_codon:yes gene_type:complete